jgi:hypothetical protein
VKAIQSCVRLDITTPADGEHSLMTLGRIEGKVDLIIDKLSGHDKRIAAVEKKVWYAGGVAAVLSVIAAKLGLPLLWS